jgi:hypothetical protein
VVNGLDVVKAIEAVGTPGGNVKEKVVMTSVSIEESD